MALINCTECGKEISDKAVSCPHCGAPIKRKIETEASYSYTNTQKTSLSDDLLGRFIGKMIGWLLYAKPLSDNWSVFIGWSFAFLFLWHTYTSFVAFHIISGFLYLICALLLLPPIRNRIFEKYAISIASIYRIMLILVIVFIASITGNNAENAIQVEAEMKAKQERIASALKEKETKHKEFLSQKNKLIELIEKSIEAKEYNKALILCAENADMKDSDLMKLQERIIILKKEALLDLIKSNKYDDALIGCNEKYPALSNTIMTPEAFCDENNKKPDELKLCKSCYNVSGIIDKRIAAKKEAELKASMGPKAWKLHKKHPNWSIEDCKLIAKNRIWVGMSYEMIKTIRGLPDSANPSNFGNGTRWQWCWHGYSPMCFYDDNDDGIIDSYN